MKQTRALLFDLFNTLTHFDHTRLPRATFGGVEKFTTGPAVWAVFRDHGGHQDWPAFAEVAVSVSRRTRHEAQRSQREISSIVRFREILAGLGWPAGPATERSAQAMMERHMELLIAATVVEPVTTQILDCLRRRYRLGLLSNFDHAPAARILLERSGLDRSFQAIAISDELGFRKPDPRAFLHVLALLDCDPATAVFVGDSPDDDIAGARAAGMEAIWLCRDGRAYPGPGSAPPTVEALVDLPELLECGTS